MKESDQDEKFVRELLERAGARPSVQSESVASIVEATRAEWRRRYGRRRRLWILPAAAAVMMGFVALWWTLRQPPAAVPSVATASTIEVAPGAEPTSLRLGGGQSLRIASGTRVRIVSDALVLLDHGAVYLDSPPGSPPDKTTIRTFAGDFTPIGTQFEVRIEGNAVDLRVREGVVMLARDRGEVTAGAGEELIVNRDGTITRREVSPHDPSWSWVVDAAPMPEIEGRPLRTFLDWIAREKGWKLKFADNRAASLANDVVLHGSVKELTPDQALKTIALSSGFSYTISDGSLIVSSP